MNIQELSTMAQYKMPVKAFIINNQWMGMVRQWQELNHGSRYSQSYTESLPDFVKLADSFGGEGMVAETADELDGVIDAMLNSEKFFLADIRVAKEENCFPMIPSGAAHNEMILNSGDSVITPKTTTAGMALV
jgi:acetolactate synthase-1/2/3 large subunit